MGGGHLSYIGVECSGQPVWPTFSTALPRLPTPSDHEKGDMCIAVHFVTLASRLKPCLFPVYGKL